MSDNKNQQDGRDRSKVDAKDPNEVEYLHQQYKHKTHEEIKAAIKAAGPLRKDIEDYLDSH